ncbi:PIN domain-containing protein [Candidatus Woesearchaeota archaeon]|nr:PIN domain-containing protein [Candidatus Woesearchaeota archaeon]
MACLETSFLIDLLRGKESVRQLKDELDRTETSLLIAAPSLMELWSGAHFAKASTAEKEKIAALAESFEVLPLDASSAKEAGEIEADLLARGVTIQAEDVMIAGIARLHGQKVVTRDNDYVRIPGLKILKY